MKKKFWVKFLLSFWAITLLIDPIFAVAVEPSSVCKKSKKVRKSVTKNAKKKNTALKAPVLRAQKLSREPVSLEQIDRESVDKPEPKKRKTKKIVSVNESFLDWAGVGDLLDECERILNEKGYTPVVNVTHRLESVWLSLALFDIKVRLADAYEQMINELVDTKSDRYTMKVWRNLLQTTSEVSAKMQQLLDDQDVRQTVIENTEELRDIMLQLISLNKQGADIQGLINNKGKRKAASNNTDEVDYFSFDNLEIKAELKSFLAISQKLHCLSKKQYYEIRVCIEMKEINDKRCLGTDAFIKYTGEYIENLERLLGEFGREADLNAQNVELRNLQDKKERLLMKKESIEDELNRIEKRQNTVRSVLSMTQIIHQHAEESIEANKRFRESFCELHSGQRAPAVFDQKEFEQSMAGADKRIDQLIKRNERVSEESRELLGLNPFGFDKDRVSSTSKDATDNATTDGVIDFTLEPQDFAYSNEDVLEKDDVSQHDISQDDVSQNEVPQKKSCCAWLSDWLFHKKN